MAGGHLIAGCWFGGHMRDCAGRELSVGCGWLVRIIETELVQPAAMQHTGMRRSR
eukprot:SAG25_NODE_2056_length_1993_cov_78.871415_4_plen_55_part_00